VFPTVIAIEDRPGDLATDLVSVTWWVQGPVSGRHFDRPKFSFGH